MKTTYTHDAHGRLLSVTTDSGSTSYTYDAAGNRTAVTTTSVTQQAQPARPMQPRQRTGTALVGDPPPGAQAVQHRPKGTVVVDPSAGKCAYCGAVMAPTARACTSCGRMR